MPKLDNLDRIRLQEGRHAACLRSNIPYSASLSDFLSFPMSLSYFMSYQASYSYSMSFLSVLELLHVLT